MCTVLNLLITFKTTFFLELHIQYIRASKNFKMPRTICKVKMRYKEVFVLIRSPSETRIRSLVQWKHSSVHLYSNPSSSTA